jgi:hypothetical protein
MPATREAVLGNFSRRLADGLARTEVEMTLSEAAGLDTEQCGVVVAEIRENLDRVVAKDLPAVRKLLGQDRPNGHDLPKTQ